MAASRRWVFSSAKRSRGSWPRGSWALPAFREAIRFAENCISEGIRTELTFVDVPEVDVESCRSIAERIGAGFRLRPLITVESEEVSA